MRKMATSRLASLAALNLFLFWAFCAPKTILLFAVAVTATVLSAVIIASNVDDPKPEWPGHGIDVIASSRNIFAFFIAMIFLIFHKTKMVNFLSSAIELISMFFLLSISFISFLLHVVGDRSAVPIIINILLYFLAQIATIGIALKIRSAIS